MAEIIRQKRLGRPHEVLIELSMPEPNAIARPRTTALRTIVEAILYLARLPMAAASGGYDAGKKIKGRKRYIITDSEGNMVGLTVHPADMQDRDGAVSVITSIRRLGARSIWRSSRRGDLYLSSGSNIPASRSPAACNCPAAVGSTLAW